MNRPDGQEPVFIAPLAKFSYLTTRYPRSSHFPYIHLFRTSNLHLIIETVFQNQHGGSREQFEQLRVIEGTVTYVRSRLHSKGHVRTRQSTHFSINSAMLRSKSTLMSWYDRPQQTLDP